MKAQIQTECEEKTGKVMLSEGKFAGKKHGMKREGKERGRETKGILLVTGTSYLSFLPTYLPSRNSTRIPIL